MVAHNEDCYQWNVPVAVAVVDEIFYLCCACASHLVESHYLGKNTLFVSEISHHVCVWPEIFSVRDDDEVFAEEVEPSDIFKTLKEDPEPVDVPEEEIKPVEEQSSEDPKEDSEDNKNDTHFMQGMTVRFKEHNLARTADGVNQIKDCNYKFISYDQENPLTCFITRGNKQRKFQVLVASLEPVNQ